MTGDAALAASIAQEAGALLLAIRKEGGETGRALGDRGDGEANALILARLHAECPEDFVLSEESSDDRRRCDARRVWIVDPLDGTREYAEGRDDWAVHVGLTIDGVATVGAVALPGAGTVLSTADVTAAPPPSHPLRMVVSRTRPAREALAVAQALGAELLPMGSAGAKAMAVVTGAADLYLHSGGQYEWDSCAPVAVARAAGLHASRLDGSPLRYNNADTWLPDLMICRPELVADVAAILAAIPPAMAE